jgi:hypothetical protein
MLRDPRARSIAFISKRVSCSQSSTTTGFPAAIV